MAQRNGGTAKTKAPNPAVLIFNSRPQPTGTANTNLSAARKPALAPMAADKVVLGPGVKLVAVANSSKAPHSVAVMAL
jgi:hypothetical protein